MDSVTASSPRGDLRARIVEASARLVSEHGAGALTTRAAADAAGVQAPTIYRLFGDKDGLVDAVAEHAMATFVAAKIDAGADPDPVVALRSGWKLQIEFALSNPALYALTSEHARSRRSPATEAGLEVLRSRVRALAAAGMLRVGEHRALAVIRAAGTGVIQVLLESRDEARDPDLADVMLDAALASILVAGTGAGAVARGEVAAAVIEQAEERVPDSAIAAAVTFAAHLPELPALTDAERSLLAEWVGRAIDSAQAVAPGP